MMTLPHSHVKPQVKCSWESPLRLPELLASQMHNPANVFPSALQYVVFLSPIDFFSKPHLLTIG